MVFLTISVLIASVSSSVLTVTTPAVQKSFDVGLTSVEWTAAIFTMCLGATMLLWGRIGDIVGHRVLFVGGNVLFAAASVLVAVSPNIGIMIAALAIQALGAAMVLPATLAMVATMFQGRERPLAYGINGASTSVGYAVGYIVGGLAVDYLSWRYAYLLNVAFCALCIYGGLRYLPRHEQTRWIDLDRLGAALSLTGLVLALFGLIEAQTYGWWTKTRPFELLGRQVPLPISIAPLALIAGAALLVWFTLTQLARKRAGRLPLFDVALFRHASFRWSGIDTFLRASVQFAVFYALSLYLQHNEGFSALKAGIAAVPIALASTAAAPIGAQIAVRLGAQRSVLAGLVLQTLGIAGLWLAVTEHTTVWTILVPNLFLGLGIGMATAQLTVTILQDVPAEQTSEATAAAATLRQIGFAIGAVTVGIVLSTTTSQLANPDSITTGLDGFRDNMVLNTAISLATIAFALAIPNQAKNIRAARKPHQTHPAPA